MCLFTGGVCTLLSPVGAVETVPAPLRIAQGEFLHIPTGMKSLTEVRTKGFTPVFKIHGKEAGKRHGASSSCQESQHGASAQICLRRHLGALRPHRSRSQAN